MKPLTKTVVSRGGIAAQLVPAGQERMIDRISRIETRPDVTDGELNITRTRAANSKLKKPKNTGEARERRGRAPKVKAAPVTPTSGPDANKPRYIKWRKANPELYKKRQAAYMRDRRAKLKAAKEAK